jgi:N4-gp56 family major capsid protein
MAMTTTATSNFANLVAIAVNEQAQQALRSRLVWATPDSYVPFTHKPGTNAFYAPAYGDVAYQSNSATLSEGTFFTAIQPITISFDSFTATQKGTVLGVSDLAQWESPNALANVLADKIARWGAEGIDWSLHAAIDASVATASEIYGGSATTRAAVGTVANGFGLTGLLVKKLVARARQANIVPFDNGNYRMIISPRQYFDLSTETSTASLQDLSKYTPEPAGELLANMVGSFGGTDLLMTTNATTFATAGLSGVDVLRGVIFGKGAFGMGDVSTLEVLITAGNDHADPLNQTLLVGSKFWVGATALCAAGNKYIAFETSATALAAGQA